ncbi:MAG TPA: zf-HC2 domain-containing protein [Holophagaceae bacterium]|nr:zf-HC2 domain-containing protein [Holophagaceae bacterium]
MEDRFKRPADADLTEAILARTSGSPCARMRELACDFADGALDAERRMLAQAHLDHCPGCAALVAALGASAAVLPRFAEADPGPWFTQQVLRATVWAPRPASRARAWWGKLMRRPRIALEAAYLGTLAGFAGFSLPPASLAKAWRVPAAVQPLAASARNLLHAEQRTAQAVAGIFVSPQGRPPGVVQRFLAKLRAWLGGGEPAEAPPRPSHQTHD